MGKKRIMVVEDESITAMRILSSLEKMGYAVTSPVFSGEKAVKKVEEERPDLVLMDIVLRGEKDGIEAAGQIRSRFNIPVIYVSANSDEKMLKRIKKTEPFGYIIKPFDDRELRIAVGIALYKHDIEERLRESEERFHTLFEQASDAIVIFDAETGKLTQFNNRACENLGYTRGEFRNLKLSDIEVIECPDSISKNMEKIKKEGRCTFETKQRTKDGRIQDILVNAKVVCIREKDYIQSIWIDITERKIMERQLITAATTDELTGLFNRRGFFTLAEQQCKLSDRTKRLMSLLYLDIDGLKTINDELGHREGDRALIDTANVLKRTFRESDIIARIGGDEFAVLLTEPSESDVENVVVNHLQNRLKEFNIQEDRNYELILSIGMSHYDPERPCSIDELFTRADDLMYYDKKYHKLLLNTETVLKIKVERREYKRYSVSNNYEAELDDSGRVNIKNISNGGICLKTSQRLDTGSIYKVKMFPSDNEVLATSGIIVWSSLTVKETDEKSILHQYELGLRFIEMKDSLKSSLEKLITSLAS